MDLDSVLGMFAIRCKYLQQLDYEGPSPEVDFAIFVRKNIALDKIYAVQNLRLRCCFAGNLSILDV